MRILVHFPTRGRREQAQRTLEGYFERCDDTGQVIYSVACNSEADVPAFTALPPIISPFHSKIAAYNAVPTDIEWDILVAASDDMWCVQKGWDTIVREAMTTHFPDTDGFLWFSDGRQPRICTLSIMGRKYFERFGYVYHGDYRSFFCDNEATEVAESLGKLYRDQRCLFKNEHPTWGGVMPADDTYRKNDPDYRRDQRVYHERKLKGFPK